MIEANRASTIEAIRRSGADVGIAWDGDYDRCFFFDEQGTFIEGYYLVGLLAEVFLKREKGGRIVHDPRLTWNTIDVVERNGGKAVLSKSGHAFIKQVMRDADAVYGGEMSAHHYFRDFAYCDSGMIPWLLVLAVMVFTLSGWLTLMALAPWPLMSWVMWRLGEQLHRRFDAAQAAFSHLNAVTQESVAGLRALRGLGAEAHAESMLSRASDAATVANLGVARIDSRYDPVIYLTVGASFLVSIGGGAWLISRGRLTIGELTTFTMYLGQLVWPMFAFGWMANLLQRGKAAWERIQTFLRTPSAVPDDGTLAAVTDHRLEVRIDEFAYPGRTQPALADVGFTLAPGHTLGIVGPTGSGKSTLLALIARFHDDLRVHIRLGGHPLADYRLDALRAAVALVMQESVLFSDSLRENLVLARPGADEAAVAAALRMSALERDLAQLPAALATEVGERGVTLSGGQRQRLCLARALIAEARILLLDDALSAVDAETEHRILGELERHTRHLSRVIVSHRLSAVQSADEILVLREGRVAERGTHAALLAGAGWYAQTWRYQQLAASVEQGP